MKTLSIVALCIALSFQVEAFHHTVQKSSVKFGQMCGSDDCNCGPRRGEKPEAA